MDHHEAQAALAESTRRRQQTIDAGSAPWPWRTVLVIAGAIVALGLVNDLEMVWLSGVVVLVVAGAVTTKAVALRGAKSPGNWLAVLLIVFVVALGADIAVQFVVRGADLPLPNTWGATAAAAIVIVLARPLQARAAASLRP